MKRHALGFFIGIVTFAGGFLSAPITFTNTSNGHGATEDLQHPCWIAAYSSSHFARVALWSCSFDEDDDRASDHFNTSLDKYKVLIATETRAIVTYSVDDFTGYCVLRLDGNRRNDVCSDSLRDALAFEQQRFP